MDLGNGHQDFILTYKKHLGVMYILMEVHTTTHEVVLLGGGDGGGDDEKRKRQQQWPACV